MPQEPKVSILIHQSIFQGKMSKLNLPYDTHMFIMLLCAITECYAPCINKLLVMPFLQNILMKDKPFLLILLWKNNKTLCK